MICNCFHLILVQIAVNAKPPGTREPLTPLANARAAEKRARDADVISEEEAEQPKKKRRRGIRLNLNASFENVSETPKTSKIPPKASANDEEQEEENADKDVDRVKKVRKREDVHEFLVKWKNSDDEEWIGHDTAVSKYPQHVIAYYQSILRFK